MGLRFSKSIKLGKGVNLNFSKSGIGMSVGTKGMRVGTGPRGSRISANIPGTGIGYSKQFGKSRKKYSKKNDDDYIENPIITKIKIFFKTILFSFITLFVFVGSLSTFITIFKDFSFTNILIFLIFVFLTYKSFRVAFPKKINEQNNTDDLED